MIRFFFFVYLQNEHEKKRDINDIIFTCGVADITDAGIGGIVVG